MAVFTRTVFEIFLFKVGLYYDPYSRLQGVKGLSLYNLLIRQTYFVLNQSNG